MISFPHHKRITDADVLFKSVLHVFGAIAARQPASGGITVAQMRALWHLDQAGAATLTEIASRLGVTCPTAQEVVDKLVAAGYVRKTRGVDDRRQVRLELLARGRKLMDDAARQRRGRLQALLHRLGKKDAGRFVQALRTLDTLVKDRPTQGAGRGKGRAK